MNTKIITKAQIDKLAREIRQYLLDRKMWVDTIIYFNGKAFSTDDRHGRYYYNDPHNLIVLENEDPHRITEYAGDILTMNYGEPSWRVEEELRDIFKKYGLWFELGNAWNLTAVAY